MSISRKLSQIGLSVDQVKITFSLTWLVILPAGVWAVAVLYVPILGASLNMVQTWTVAVLCAGLIVTAVLGHSLFHVLAARQMGDELPNQLILHVFGDAAQVWPAARSTGHEIISTLSGSVFNLICAGVAYMVWNAQLNPVLNVSMPFWALYNLWLILSNLTPVFPLDGGRFTRAFLRGLLKRPGLFKQIGSGLGFILAAFLVGWGGYLLLQRDRYSPDTGFASIGSAVILVVGLVGQKSWQPDKPGDRTPGIPNGLRMILAGMVLCGLLALSSSLLLTNNGLEAPGVALSVEPMIIVPAKDRHDPKGTFILTTVLQQSPVPAGALYAARLIPALKVLPPEKNQPNQVSPQENARQGFQMLDQSETTALAVGLREAGYPVHITSRGVAVVSILPGSPSQGLLQSGDVIKAFNGTIIQTPDQLIQLVKAQNPQSKIQLSVLRGEQIVEITVPLMPPVNPGAPPRLGISIASAGSDYQLPFPAKIVPQKIVGGPSAGLMFTLTVDNLLSPIDLTGGRKIAGTGTINPDGTVGPIGGVEQKVAAAELAGASIFFSPAENYKDALAVARTIKVVKVDNVDQAIAYLRSLSGK